jgi:hypothetical protein
MISQPPIIGDYKKVRKITRRGGREGQKKGKKKEIEKKRKKLGRLIGLAIKDLVYCCWVWR